MYGYVRPARDELRVREYKLYRAAYCGLCEALRRRGGFIARFAVSYDMTFLAMALSEKGELTACRCPVHPLRRAPCLCKSPALDRCADYTLILAWWKLRDDIADKSFPASIPARLGCLLLRKCYRRAAARETAFDTCARERLSELAALEKERSDSLDRTADCFARILASAAGEGDARSRVLRELFYHMGRYVYLLDAVDDYADDTRTGSYNPIAAHFALSDAKLPADCAREIRETMNLSQHRAAAALELRERDEWTPILENIVTLGLPGVTDLVFSGKWRESKKKEKKFKRMP